MSFLIEGNRKPRSHGVRLLWNDPKDKDGKHGAIQLADRVREQFCRKKVEAYVYIEETRATIRKGDLKIQRNKKAALG